MHRTDRCAPPVANPNSMQAWTREDGEEEERVTGGTRHGVVAEGGGGQGGGGKAGEHGWAEGTVQRARSREQDLCRQRQRGGRTEGINANKAVERLVGR